MTVRLNAEQNVRACVRAGGRACVCVCVRACARVPRVRVTGAGEAFGAPDPLAAVRSGSIGLPCVREERSLNA